MNPVSNVNIVYEDDSLIVLDKPAGMLVIPTPKNEANTLTAVLNRHLDNRGIQINAYPCHRLDRDTSGLIVYAKGKKAQKIMMDKFRERGVRKLYLGFVHGHLNRDKGVIDIPVEGKRSVTKYNVIGRGSDFSVVEVEPVTGRTNQIRIHFKSAGHPLVGERRFAFAKDFKLKFRRTALHSYRLEFTHPVTDRPLTFTSPLPDDMERFLKERQMKGGLV